MVATSLIDRHDDSSQEVGFVVRRQWRGKCARVVVAMENYWGSTPNLEVAGCTEPKAAHDGFAGWPK